MRRRRPESLGDILAGARQTTPVGVALQYAQIWDHWGELVGPHLSEHGRPRGIREDGALVIEAESAVWVHRFTGEKWDLFHRINLMAGHQLISEIFVTLANEIPPPQSEQPPDGQATT